MRRMIENEKNEKAENGMMVLHCVATMEYMHCFCVFSFFHDKGFDFRCQGRLVASGSMAGWRAIMKIFK